VGKTGSRVVVGSGYAEGHVLWFYANSRIAEVPQSVYTAGMKMTLTVTDRGTVTLPSKLRKEMGIGADSLLIAETTEEGILLRPAVALPVEVYSQERLTEFAAAEHDLAQWYGDPAG